MSATKLCNKCHRDLPLDAFAKHSAYKDGLQYYCRGCVSEDRRKQRQAAKDALAGRKFEGDRLCKTCNRTMAVSAFYPDLQRKDGLSTHCKDCQLAYTKNWQRNNAKAYNTYQRDYNQRFRDEQPEKARRRRRAQHAKKYGITVDEYDELLRQPTCAICRESFGPELKPNLDHCHATGRIRGVLCTFCNKGLGQFQDNIERLLGAIAYLKS